MCCQTYPAQKIIYALMLARGEAYLWWNMVMVESSSAVRRAGTVWLKAVKAAQSCK